MLMFKDKCTYRGFGAVSWFPVHCTSINNTNSLISGDNKGVAAQLMEKWGSKANVSDDSLIAAFAQANVGDTSPNTRGAFCADTGKNHRTHETAHESCSTGQKHAACRVSSNIMCL